MTEFRSRGLSVIRSRTGQSAETPADPRRAREYGVLTGRLSADEARRIGEAFVAVGPPVMPAGATPSAATMTPAAFAAAGEIGRGERHNGRPPPQPERRVVSAREIERAAAKARET